jgi:hypothetical protein
VGEYNIIIVFIYHLSKKLVLIPYNKDIGVEEIVRLFIKHVYRHYSPPNIIISDRDPRLVLAF